MEEQLVPDRSVVSPTADIETALPPLTIELPGKQRLQVHNSARHSELALLAADGRVQLRVIVTPDGPVLQIDGGRLTVRSSGDLALEAERLALVGRSGLTLHSDADVVIHASNDVHSVGRIQHISADLGNVNIRANDDVTLNGERVLVNCDDV
jgi:hypothetical protein